MTVLSGDTIGFSRMEFQFLPKELSSKSKIPSASAAWSFSFCLTSAESKAPQLSAHSEYAFLSGKTFILPRAEYIFSPSFHLHYWLVWMCRVRNDTAVHRVYKQVEHLQDDLPDYHLIA